MPGFLVAVVRIHRQGWQVQQSRHAVIGDDADDLAERLVDVVDGARAPAYGAAARHHARVAFADVGVSRDARQTRRQRQRDHGRARQCSHEAFSATMLHASSSSS